MAKNRLSSLCTNPLGAPPPPPPALNIRNKGKTHTYGPTHAVHTLDGPCRGSQYQKKLSKTLIFELPGVKSCISRLCTNPLEDTPDTPPHLPPHPPTHLPQKLQKVGLKWEGGLGEGVRTKNSLGDALIGRNNDFTRG